MWLEILCKDPIIKSRGFEQNDFGEFAKIHTPVARLWTLEVLIPICNHFNLTLKQFDVKNAFLNRTIKIKVFNEFSEGCKISNHNKGKIYLLKRASYEIK